MAVSDPIERTAFLEALSAYVRNNQPEIGEGPEFKLRYPLMPRNDFCLSPEWIESACQSLTGGMAGVFPDFGKFHLDASMLARIVADMQNLNGKAIWNLSRKIPISSPHFTLFCLYLLRPFRRRVATVYASFLNKFPVDSTFCPLCGAPSALVIAGTPPEVWCCHCGSRRTYPAHSCPSCAVGNPELQKIEDMQVMTCAACRRFFKVVPDSEAEMSDLYFAATSPIDEQMHARGWVREYPILPATPLDRL